MEEKKPVTEIFTEKLASAILADPIRGGRLAVAIRQGLEGKMKKGKEDLEDVVDDITQQIDDDTKYKFNFSKGWRWFVRIILVVMILGGVYKLATDHMDLETMKYKYDSIIKKQTEAKTSEQGAR